MAGASSSPDVAVMWFRRDLRVRDLPALAAAARHQHTVPLFVVDRRLITDGRFPCAKRVAFMLGCLHELDASLRERGARLIVREGRPEEEVARLAGETRAPRGGLGDYAKGRDRPAGGSSRLSPYLRWGCVSPRELDGKVAARRGDGPADFRTELAWRDFYASVLVHFPQVTHREFQERYRSLWWSRARRPFAAWQEGRTGYPLVDAGMRQLLAEGWMHNRVRMVVGSFLTKDLHLDWRWGERHFMHELVDRDMAANNGGWQWIASTGTDPAPYFQRMLNPITQQRRHDPDGTYVRRWVPELAQVPLDRLAEPWAMSAEEQATAGCLIGRHYPAPIVEHADERRRAIERYRQAR